MRKLLVIDDDVLSCRLVVALFRGEPLDITTAHDVRTGLVKFCELSPDIVLLDLHLPDGDGISLLQELRTRSASVPVLMLTSQNDVKTAVRAVQHGASDYMTKPIDGDALIARVRRELQQIAARDRLDASGGRGEDLAALLGTSESAQRIAEQIEAVAPTDSPVLITGEIGTGKDTVAQAIHARSMRRDAPFVAVDCNALPAWLLESELFSDDPARTPLPQGATLYFDDIAALPADRQPRLLHLLDDARGALSVRVIATGAPNVELRSDLYFRLAQYAIELPPLRERRTDIAHFARRMLAAIRAEQGRDAETFEVAAMALLERHSWPGNLRELRNVLQQAAIDSGAAAGSLAVIEKVIERSPFAAATPAVGARTLKEISDAAARAAEHQAIVETLRSTGGNKSLAARLLKTDYKTLHTKIKQLGIDAREYED